MFSGEPGELFDPHNTAARGEDIYILGLRLSPLCECTVDT